MLLLGNKGYWRIQQDRNFEKTEGVEFLRVNFEILYWKSRRSIHADGQFRGDYMMGKNQLLESSSLANLQRQNTARFKIKQFNRNNVVPLYNIHMSFVKLPYLTDNQSYLPLQKDLHLFDHHPLQNSLMLTVALHKPLGKAAFICFVCLNLNYFFPNNDRNWKM